MTVSQVLELPAAAWYGDVVLQLPVPDTWSVTVHLPRLPPPIGDAEIRAAIDYPVAGQAPISELARGSRRPVIIVDDLSRPTPVERALPHVLEQLARAGHPKEQVTIVVGGGTHRPAEPEQLVRKVGAVAAACRLVAHDCERNVVAIGRTRRGIPVVLNRHVAAADFLVGIGGVYPQHSVGFGGGSKLLLGVLGKRSITHLHYGHGSVAGTYDFDNSFRRELDEMAAMAGLRTIVTLHVDGRRQVVKAVSGDHFTYYRAAAQFSRDAYAVPGPAGADVVIADAYPMDTSLTFTRSKGMAPVFRARPGASRIVISACSEGVGHHGLFPFMNRPRFEKQIHIARRISVLRPRTLPGKLVSRARRRLAAPAPSPPPDSERPAAPALPTRPIWLYPAGRAAGSLPAQVPGLHILYGWDQVVDRIREEQRESPRLNVAVYPCASLLCVGVGEATTVADHLAGAVAG